MKRLACLISVLIVVQVRAAVDQEVIKQVQNSIQCTQTGLSSLQCRECVSAGKIGKVLETAPPPTTETMKRQQLQTVVFMHLVNFRDSCRLRTVCETYTDCVRMLHSSLTITSSPLINNFEALLRDVKTIYSPKSLTQCFTAEGILQEVTAKGVDINTMKGAQFIASTVMENLIKGRCIDVGEVVTDFLEDLFQRYGDNSSDVMSEDGLRRLLQDLRSFTRDHDSLPAVSDGAFNGIEEDHYGHDHSGHDHSHHSHSHDRRPTGNRPTLAVFQRVAPIESTTSRSDQHHDHDHGDDHAHSHDHEEETENSTTPGSTLQYYDHHHGHHHPGSAQPHDHDHDDHHMEEIKKSTTQPDMSTKSFDHDHAHHHPGEDQSYDHDHEHHHMDDSRLRRSVPKDDAHAHTSMANKCWTTAELVGKFGQSDRNFISRNEFLQLCPAVVQQAVSAVCNQDGVLENDNHNKTPIAQLSTAEKYLYSSIAVFLISMCSLVGVLILPFLARYAYYYIMQGFIGLSFATMSGDALLHLIPQILGVHTHEEGGSDGHEGHSHSHGGEEEDYIPAYFFKLLAMVGVIYALFLFEAISGLFGGEGDEGHGHGHGHSHVPEFNLKDMRMKKSDSRKTLANNLSSASVSDMARTESSVDIEGNLKADPKDAPTLETKPILWGMSSLALMIIAGGAVHNVADGLAIGAAFSTAKGGVSTTLAVFFHELPHELGDFVVLISTGLSYKRALFLNFVSSLFAFAGLFLGLLLGQSNTTREYIMAITAAIFIYVAFVDMLPELKKFRGKSPIKMLIVKNIGVISGLAIMALIAIFEDKLPI